MKKVFASFAFLLVGSFLIALTCPQDGLIMWWTGETQVEWGKLEKIYECPEGHRYAVPDNPASSSLKPTSQVICPLDGMSMYFTGRMHGLAKVYKCPAGHTVDVK